MPGLVEIFSGRMQLVDSETGAVVMSSQKWLVVYWDGDGFERDRMAVDSIDWAAEIAEKFVREQGAMYVL